MDSLLGAVLSSARRAIAEGRALVLVLLLAAAASLAAPALSGVVALGAMHAQATGAPGVQGGQRGTSGASSEVERVLRELGNRFYWPDRRALSGVRECQARFGRICVAEHGVLFGVRPVDLFSGIPTPSSNAPLDSGDVHIFALERLETMARDERDNGWAVGHLVLLHSYNTSLGVTLDFLRDCRGASWWCDALRGLAFHSYSRYDSADSLFRVSLAAMPREERCRWRDISVLLDSAALAAYRPLGCEAREEFEERFWWLSDPLYLIPGNDRRTEHYSRRVMDSLFRGAPTPFNAGDDRSYWDAVAGEILVRYGMAAHWIVPGKLTNPGDASDRWLHYHTPSYSFAPRGMQYSGTSVVKASDFSLDSPLSAVTERYHPNYDFVTGLANYQVAVLPRGDSMLVAGALDLGRERFAAAGPFTAGMVLTTGPNAAPVRRTIGVASERALLNAVVAREDMLLSLEVMSNPLLVSARSRFTVKAPGAGTALLSEPVLFRADGSALPSSAAELFRVMHHSTRILTGAPLGVYWEMPGVEGELRMTARVTRTSGPGAGILGFLRSERSRQASITWEERATGDAGGHAVVMDVTALAEGAYTLTLEVRGGNVTLLTSERQFELLRRDASHGDMWRELQQAVPAEDFPTTGASPTGFRSRPAILRTPY